jgi:hypothetical protein
MDKVPSMTLRDYFAAKAMQGLVVAGNLHRPTIARTAYDQADEMLKATGAGMDKKDYEALLKAAELALESLDECSISPDEISWGPAYESAKRRRAQAINALRDSIDKARGQE